MAKGTQKNSCMAVLSHTALWSALVGALLCWSLQIHAALSLHNLLFDVHFSDATVQPRSAILHLPSPGGGSAIFLMLTLLEFDCRLC